MCDFSNCSVLRCGADVSFGESTVRYGSVRFGIHRTFRYGSVKAVTKTAPHRTRTAAKYLILKTLIRHYLLPRFYFFGGIRTVRFGAVSLI